MNTKVYDMKLSSKKLNTTIEFVTPRNPLQWHDNHFIPQA